MNERQFREVMDTCLEKSGNDLKDYLSQFEDEPIVVSLLTGTEFDDIGIGRTTGRQAAETVWPDFEDSEGSLTESIKSIHTPYTPGIDGHDIDQLYLDLEMLESKSGQDQQDFLADMFEDYAYPSVVSYAVLSDQSLGFGESTLAKAFGVKDSLPFYDDVASIIRDDKPLTSPEAGKPFDPMLAVPESRGQPDNAVAQRKVDGYRILIHIGRTEEEFINDKKSDDTVRAFTRSMNEVTESLPELQEIDFSSLGGHYILDGEVIAENGSYSDTSSRIGRSAENVERDIEMEFSLFDVPLFRGVDMSDEPFNKRHKNLINVVEAIDDERVYHLGLKGDIELAKDEAIANDEEGIIVKDMEGPYEYGKRSKYWQKVKMDDETVDVRISGFEEAQGDKSGTLGAVALETADGSHIGKSGSGFSDAQREEIWQNQNEWMGRCIEVEARGIGTQGNLRMPIFKRDRSDDGEPDTRERIEEVMKDV